MEKVEYVQWVVEDEQEEQEVQDASLKGRQISLQHPKLDGIINGAGDSDDANGGAHSGTDGVSSKASVDTDEQPLIQKEDEIEEILTTDIVENGNSFNSDIVENGNHSNSDIVENGNHFNSDIAGGAVGLGVVAEQVGEEGAATNGEVTDTATTINGFGLQNKNNVYFDKEQGNDFNGLTGVQNGNGEMPVLPVSHGVGEVDIQVENSDLQNGDGPTPDLPISHGVGEIDIHVENSAIQNGHWNEISNRSIKIIDDKATVENFGDENSAKAGPNLIKEIDQKLEELDVEAVLAKQKTHDLFCPNCNHCITERVILKKRKRNNINKNLDTKGKRDKLETEAIKSSAQEDNRGDDAIATSDAGTIEQPANNDEPEREQEVFRCLSCFSFFIPLRNGIKLFPNFGAAREPETSSQTPLITPASNLENPSSEEGESKENWFFSLFTSNGRKKAHGQDGQLADRSVSKNIQPTPDTKIGHEGADSPISSTVMAVQSESQMKSSINSSDLMNGNVIANVGEKKNDSVDMIKTDTVVADMPLMSSSNDIASKCDTVILAAVAAAATTTGIHFNLEKTAKEAILKSYDEEPLIHEKSQKDVDKTRNNAQNNYSSSMQEAQSPAKSFDNAASANDVASDTPSSGVLAAIPPGLDFVKAQNDIEEEINLSVEAEALKSPTSQTEDNVPDKGAIATQEHTQIDIGEEPRAETSEHQKWEIVKSIVYGGLIESITSLGIVSSAISSGVAPLNIIALGLANLIGGLFIIGHDLIELKNNHSGGDSRQTNRQESRYQERLGQRENFLLHAFVVVVSFLFFGSVPLIVYGLLIHENYYAQDKVAAVAATSVVCIVLLAVGKAYTRRAPKSYSKTVLQYVTIALSTSGVSYIAGELLKNLLEKLNPPESGVVLSMPFSGTARIEPSWMSY